MAKIKQQFTITYERTVDTDSGEILETTIIGSSDIKPEKKKAVKKDNDVEAKVYLEDNKLRLNSLAIKMLEIAPGDRIDVQYTNDYPIIGLAESFGNSEGGTKLSKTNTISFRGKKSENLSKFGTEFVIKPSNNQFILDSGKKKEVPKVLEEINTEEIDLDLDSFLEDNNKITSSMFQL